MHVRACPTIKKRGELFSRYLTTRAVRRQLFNRLRVGKRCRFFLNLRERLHVFQSRQIASSCGAVRTVVVFDENAAFLSFFVVHNRESHLFRNTVRVCALDCRRIRKNGKRTVRDGRTKERRRTAYPAKPCAHYVLLARLHRVPRTHANDTINRFVFCSSVCRVSAETNFFLVVDHVYCTCATLLYVIIVVRARARSIRHTSL